MRLTTHTWQRVLPALLVLSGSAMQAHAQCMLANPSFEMLGSSGPVFGGWNQFNIVGNDPSATHGVQAARVSGYASATWVTSGYWQGLDTQPGDRWVASVRAWHTDSNPLVGDSRALLNIEWRDAAGDLISYESHTVADANTPIDAVQDFQVGSDAAPASAVSVRLVLMLLQSPGDAIADAYFDEATFNLQMTPSLDDQQWADFPGGRTVTFSGRNWRVKGPGVYHPGPDWFCDDIDCTWVDGNGHLHMTVKNDLGTWQSSEITLEEPLGYGDYVFTTRGRLDQLDPNVVLGLFLWQYGVCWNPADAWWGPYNEVDIEYSRWGDPQGEIAQFVAQPFDFPGNIQRYDVTFADAEITSHAFRWLPDRVEFRSWRGSRHQETSENMIHAWTYTGPHVPRPEQPRVHINLWQLADPASDQEVVFEEFHFTPEDVPTDVAPPVLAGQLLPAVPNPFNPQTTVRFSLARDTAASLRIYDAAGRLVRTLVDAPLTAGEHALVWDGSNDAGSRAASGVYLVQLAAAGALESRKVVMLK